MNKCFLLALAVCLSITTPAVAQTEKSIEVSFSPRNGATESIVKLIGHAKAGIRVAAYSFTSKEIAEALMKAQQRGVDIKVVLDKSNIKAKYSSATFLANVGIPTRINSKYAIMHNKFMIIDGVTVQTGSFNYTSAAENRNAENVMILRNYDDLALQYTDQWQKLWDESEDYEARY